MQAHARMLSRTLSWAGALALPALLSGCRRGDPLPGPSEVRVVSLAPSVTEIVCAVGGSRFLVGRTSACDYPPEVRQVPVVGGFGEPSLEVMLAARPTLVLDVDLADETHAAKLNSLGLRRERVRCRALDDIPRAILQVGALLGRDDNASALAAHLRESIAALRSQTAANTHPIPVFVEIWNDPLTTVGRNSFISELVALSGGRNVGDETGREYFEVSPEWVLVRDPAVILCFYMAPDRGVRQQVLSRSGWGQVRAVRSGNVFDGFDNNLVLRPGPRVLEGIDALRACIRKGAGP